MGQFSQELRGENWSAAAGRAALGRNPSLIPDSQRDPLGALQAKRLPVGESLAELPRLARPAVRPFTERIRMAAEMRQERGLDRLRAAIILATPHEPGLRELIGELGAKMGHLAEPAMKLLRETDGPGDSAENPAQRLRMELAGAMNSGRAYLMSSLGYSAPDADEAIDAAFGALAQKVGVAMPGAMAPDLIGKAAAIAPSLASPDTVGPGMAMRR